MERPVRPPGACRGTCAGSSMTRIVSGSWRGRRLVVPKGGDVRPTAERVREAWLNILAPELCGARVVDLFAGSGALGLEALSRGAIHATFVEMHGSSLAALRANIATLGAEAQVTVHRADATRFVADLPVAAYDVALADPPFASDFAGQIVTRWHAVPFASVLAVEHSRKTELPGGTTRRWGDIAVTFFRAS
jgi:16S rRNA (guanine966-N2)-methyltransferase